MACLECGGSLEPTDDGFYVCTVCGTQRLDFVEEAGEWTQVPAGSSGFARSSSGSGRSFYFFVVRARARADKSV